MQTTVCIHTSLTIISLSFLFCLFLNNIVHSCNIERSDPLVLYMLIFFCKGLVLVFDFIFVDMIKKRMYKLFSSPLFLILVRLFSCTEGKKELMSQICVFCEIKKKLDKEND